MIGNATVRESRLAWSRENPRQRAAARVAPLRETPGTSAAAWATPSARPSAARASPRPRRCGRVSAATIARLPATRPAAVERGPPSRSSIGRSNAYPIAAAGAKESASTAARRRSKRRSSSAITCALADHQRGGGAGVQGDLEALAQLGVEPLPVASRRARARSTRWAELETGSSSAGPWMAPSATALTGRDRFGGVSLNRRPRLRARRPFRASGPPPRRRLISR